MDKKNQAKDFEKVEGAQLNDEEQEQVQGSREEIAASVASSAYEELALKKGLVAKADIDGCIVIP